MRKLSGDYLSARERVLKTLNFEEPDRVPISEFMQNIQVVEFYTGQKVTPDNYFDLSCKTLSDNVDMVENVVPMIPEGIRKEGDGFVFRDQWWTTAILERPFKDLKGLKEHILREIDNLQEYHPGDEMTISGKVSLWREELGEEEFVHPKERMKRLQNKLENVVVMTESPIGMETAYYRAGMELFCWGYQDFPELIHKWIKALSDFEIKRIHDIADPKISPVALSYCDIANKNSLTFPPEFLKKEFLPFLKQHVQTWHKFGIKYIYHSEGDLREFIPELVKAGVDGIHPVEPTAMDAGELRSKYPDLALVGCIDNIYLESMGTIEVMDKKIKKIIDGAAPGGGLILTSSQISPAADGKKIIEMWNSEIKYGRYKK